MNLLFIFYAINLLFVAILADPVEDKHALLDFLDKIHHSNSHSLNWKDNIHVCNGWTGVSCNQDQSRVIALRLHGLGFHGQIPPNTLGRLSAIRVLDLGANALSGSFPSDFFGLRNLTELYLQSNDFSGPLPLDFLAWKDLIVLDLSNNHFNGSVPSSIMNLTRLTTLNIANNSLSGDIPDMDVPSLQDLSLANNNLTGSVPRKLLRFSVWSFSDNNLSLGYVDPPSAQQPSKKATKVSEQAILGITIGGCTLVFAVIALFLVCYFSKKEKERELKSKSQNTKDSSMKEGWENEDNSNRIMFFEDCFYSFDLEDLLSASAEILGKGMYGVTYKAILEDSTTVVVKRLKEVAVDKNEFKQLMEVIGHIGHENVSSPRAYYYSQDETLVLYDCYEKGSVSTLLHGKRGNSRMPLDWETRLRIAMGAARGIGYVHKQNGGKFVHGNIKASNIFLNAQNYGCISEIGLATLVNLPPPTMEVSKYCAPEITDTRRVTQESDIYSFGVVLLELLTGKSPTNIAHDEEVDLVGWVNSVISEEWTSEVFDLELLRYPNMEEEMFEMLQIAMACVESIPEKRPKMHQVLKLLEGIRKLNTEYQPKFPETNGVSTSVSK